MTAINAANAAKIFTIFALADLITNQHSKPSHSSVAATALCTIPLTKIGDTATKSIKANGPKAIESTVATRSSIGLLPLVAMGGTYIASKKLFDIGSTETNRVQNVANSTIGGGLAGWTISAANNYYRFLSNEGAKDFYSKMAYLKLPANVLKMLSQTSMNNRLIAACAGGCALVESVTFSSQDESNQKKI